MTETENVIYRTVKYQGQLIGNVAITLDTENINTTGKFPTTGTATIDGKSRKVAFRMATSGKRKGEMQWYCAG